MHYFECTVPASFKSPGGVEWLCYTYNVNYDWQDLTLYDHLFEAEERDKIELWVFFRGEFVPRHVLQRLKSPKVWISTEPIERFDVAKAYDFAKELQTPPMFDAIYHYDKTHIELLRTEFSLPIKGEFWLPVDTASYMPYPYEKKWDAVFMGRGTDKRIAWMAEAKHRFNLLHVDHGMYGLEAVRAYNMARVGLNLHVENWKQFQHRVFNMMACGIPVISERLTNEGIFDGRPNGCIVVESPADMLKNLKHLIEEPELREQLGKLNREFAVKYLDAKGRWGWLVGDVLGDH